MARKSNKTSHVLHLLAGEEPVPEAAENKEENADDINTTKQEEEKPPEPAKQQDGDMPNVSIVSAGNSEGDPLADLIKDQLEEDFPEEILEPHSQPETPEENRETDFFNSSDTASNIPTESAENLTDVSDIPTPRETAEILNEATESNLTEASAEESEKSPSVPPDIAASNQSAETLELNQLTESTEPAESEKPSETTAAADPAPVSEESPPNSSYLTKDDLESVLYPPDSDELQNYRFVNVMEYIVKDLVIEYMKKFDMCTCERCVVDTMALTLTFCHAKYIVVDKHTVSPLLNYYSNKFLGDVTVELTKACLRIKENPRH